MNNIYQYILKNKTLDNLIKSVIEGESIVIIKENNAIDNLIDYFKEFIVNYVDEEGVLNLINKIEKNNHIDKIKMNKFTMLGREINNNKESILNIFSFFNKKGDMNYSLNDLYSITNKCIEFKDREFEYYSILSKSDVIKNNERDTIIEKATNLIKNKSVNAYIKYRKFEDSKRFDIIRGDLDKDDLDKVINKLSGILNNIFAFTPPIYFNEYTSDFERESIYYKNYNNDEIMQVVKEINRDHNEYILEDIINLKWYKASHILNYKKIIKKNRSINEEYNGLEIEIYNQYLENIDNLKMFLNSFCFVKKVCKDEVLDNINKFIMSDDELYNYIKYIKETLLVYNEYLVIKKELEKLDVLDIDILDFHYENLNNKKELSNLLMFIPIYYLYREIEYIETEGVEIVNSYGKVYERLRRLNTALFAYDELLLEVLRDFCNKNLYEFINNSEIELEKLNCSELAKDKYSSNNLRILLKSYPILIIDEEEYHNYKETVSSYFDLIIKSSDFLFDDSFNNISNCRMINESLDKSITHLLLNLGYDIFEKEDDISIIYINNYKVNEKKKIIYINNKECFLCSDLIELLKLSDLENEIIFVWYRNWWLNKNEEIQRIQRLLND